MSIYDIGYYGSYIYKNREDIWLLANMAYYVGYVVIKYNCKSNRILPI